MSHESVVWRGELDGGFQEQAIGNYPAISDAANKDNIYLSDQGWAYRHFTSPDKSEYWDEILWAGEVTVPPGLNDPVGVFGAEEQTFLFGDGFQFVSGNYPTTVSTIGTVTIDGSPDVEEDDAQNYKALFNGSYSGTATYSWQIFRDGVDVTLTETTLSNGSAETATITFSNPGDFVVQCTVGGSGVDSVKGAMEVVAEAGAPVYTLGVASFNPHPSIFEVTPGKNTVRLNYSGTAPLGSVTATVTASDTTNVTITGPTAQGNYPSGAYFEFDVDVAAGVALGTDITLTGNVADATASDNGAAATTTTTTFQCEGTLGTIGVTRSPSGIISPSSLPTTVTLTSTQTGSVGDQAATTIQWSINPAVPSGLRKQLEDSFTTPNAAATDVVIPTNMEIGNTQFICTYSNPAMNPQQKSGAVLVTVL